MALAQLNQLKVEPLKREINDNSIDTFPLVSVCDGSKFISEFTVEKVVSGELNTYKLIFNAKGKLLNVTYEFCENEIETINFNSTLNSGNILLEVETQNIGENIKINGYTTIY